MIRLGPDQRLLVARRQMADLQSARAIDPYPPGAPKPTYANDPKEPLVQYDCTGFRLMMAKREGRAGARRLEQRHEQQFSKVSPTGAGSSGAEPHRLADAPRQPPVYSAFAAAKPDHDLQYAEDELLAHFLAERAMARVFIQGRSPYTQLMLTHIDAQAMILRHHGREHDRGHRAVNIPEFLNIPQAAWRRSTPGNGVLTPLQRRLCIHGERPVSAAIEAMRGALERDPDDPLAHYGLASALSPMVRTGGSR